MSFLKKIIGETAVYGLSSVVGRTLNYLLVPLYTAYFDPEQYGIVTELYAYAAFLNVIYTYGMETAYFRYETKNSGHTYFNVIFTSILISAVTFSLIIFVFSSQIATLLSYTDKAFYIKYLAIILSIDALVAIPFARLRKEGKAKQFALLKITNIILNVTLNLFFIVVCPLFIAQNPEHLFATIYDKNMGVGYVFLSNLLANGMFFVFFLPVWKNIKLVFDKIKWKKTMKYAMPLLIMGVAGVTNEMLSRTILRFRLTENFYAPYSNLAALGIFGACYKLAVFMSLAVQAFRYAFEPFLFAKSKDKDAPKALSEIMTGFIIFTTTAWVILSIFLPWYAPLLLRKSSYLLALHTVPWLLGGGMFLGIFYNLSVWYKLTDKTIYGAYITLIGAGFTIIANWILIPYIGYDGSAITTFSAYGIITIISFLWGKKYFYVPYKWKKNSLNILLATSIIIVNTLFSNSFIFSLGMVTIYLLILIGLQKSQLKKLLTTA